MTSGYQEALEAAGAEVLIFEEFGSYQGDWWAKVRVDGRLGWIHDYYGSCSGCDAFEAMFSWRADQEPDYQQRLATFGREYMDQMMTQDEAEKETTAKAERDHAWVEEIEMAEFIKRNRDAGL